MDFSDQIALAARLAPRLPEVGEAERERFKVVLLDEYQDTSVAQALMLTRLFSGPDAAHGLGHPVTAVGDPNQAIYGWRGASVSNILEFPEAFPSTGGRAASYPLTVNRRSDTRILDAANHLAAELYALRRRAPAARAQAGGRAGARSRPASTRPTTTSSPPWATPWRPLTPPCPSRRGARSASSPATTPTPPTSSTP